MNGRRGAYGIAVSGLESEDRFLTLADPSWPTVRIVIDPRAVDAGGTRLDAELACYPEAPTGRGEVDLHAGAARFLGVDGLTADEIVHPRLGMVAAVYAQWLPGRMAFHAGAFVAGGRAWGVVGDRFDGKSTVMAALALGGVAVLGDDTLVLEELRCLPGVRCVDLRADAAAQLGVVDAAASVRRGDRHRLALGDAPSDAALAGWFFLNWGDELAVRALSPPERVARIANHQGWHRRGVTDPAELLEVAALPAWEVSRPRDWALLPRVLDRVLELAR